MRPLSVAPTHYSPSQAALRFGEIYEVTDDSRHLSQTLDLLEKRAVEQGTDLVVLRRCPCKAGHVTIFTEGDTTTGKFLRNLNRHIQEYRVKMGDFRLYQKLHLDGLMRKKRQQVITEQLMPLFKPGIGVQDVEKEFRQASAQYQQSPSDKLLNGLAEKWFRAYRKPEIEEAAFSTSLTKALEETKGFANQAKAETEASILRFDKIHNPKTLLAEALLDIEYALMRKAPLNVSDIDRWLKADIFDVRRGERKPWWPLRFLISRFSRRA